MLEELNLPLAFERVLACPVRSTEFFLFRLRQQYVSLCSLLDHVRCDASPPSNGSHSAAATVKFQKPSSIAPELQAAASQRG